MPMRDDAVNYVDAATPAKTPNQNFVQFHVLRFRSVLSSVGSFLICSHFLERLAFFSIFSSLQVFFFSFLEFSNVQATIFTSVFGWIAYLVPAAGIWYTEEILGPYKTIRQSYLPYLIGIAVCTGVAFSRGDEWFDLTIKRIVFLAGLYFGIAVGTGLYSSAIVGFSAEQFDHTDDEHLKQQKKYSRIVYWSVNVSAALAYSYIAYIAIDGQQPLNLSRERGFFVAYCVASAALLASGGFLCSWTNPIL